MKKELIIETTDPNFLNDLKNANIPDIQIWEPMELAVNFDSTPKIVELTIVVLTNISCGLVVAWLYDRFKKNSSSETTINHHNITNNITIENLNVIVDNIQNAQDDGTKKES